MTSIVLICLALFCLAVPSGAQEQQRRPSVFNLELRRTSEADGGLYYGEILVGERAKPFKVLICTSCNATWVPAFYYRHQFESACTEYACPRGTNLADPPRDSTGTYGGFHFELAYREVRLQLGPRVVANITIGLGVEFKNLHLFTRFGLSGILGTNGSPYPPFHYHRSNPINNLFMSQQIGQRIASLYLARREPQDGRLAAPAGVLTLGGLNASYYAGEVRYVPMVRENSNRMGWHLGAREVRLDWSRVVGAAAGGGRVSERVANYRPARGDDTTRLYLDSSTPYFVGYRRLLDRYLVRFMGARRFGLAGNYAFADCRLDNKPDFVFQLAGDLQLRVRPSDYVIDYEHTNGRRYCLAAFLAGNDDDDDSWTLGTQFLRNHYVVFDYYKMLVGFAEPRAG